MTTAMARTAYRLFVGDLRRTPVSVERAPQLSLLLWMTEAARPTTTSPLAAEIASVVRPHGDLFARAIGLPGLNRMPDAFLPLGDEAPDSIPDYCNWLGDADGDALAAEIDALWGPHVPRPWKVARDHPRMWLEDASRTILAAWSVFSRHWRSFELMIRREEARVGTAVVTGNVDVLLGALTPRLRATRRYIEFDGNGCGTTKPLSDGRLAFIPMYAPRRQQILLTFEPPAPYVGYSLPGTAPGDSPSDASTDRLVALLGTLRAATLRALDRPRTMGALAKQLHCAPSTLTYHCDQLAQAGLIDRERHGQSMRVSLSQRGIRFLNAIE